MFIKFPHRPGKGGPGSFQFRFEDGLNKMGWNVSYSDENAEKRLPDCIFVVGGTRKLNWLYGMKRKGVPIIYRLDGIVWLHKKVKRGLKYYMNAEIRNVISKIIHAYLSDVIVYQSRFVEQWWQREGLINATNTHIIYNGVKINSLDTKIIETKRLVVLEGTIDYSPYALKLLNDLAEKLPDDIRIELYGGFEKNVVRKQLSEVIDYKGFVERDKVYDVLKGSVYLTLDVNPACPNTVVEALACGAPVVGFNTGAVGELVDEHSGVIVEYGGDPWSLDYPDVDSLVNAIYEVFDNYQYYAINACNRASKEFDQDDMVKKYINILEKTLNEAK